MHAVLVGTVIEVQGWEAINTATQHHDLLRFTMLETQVKDRSLTVLAEEVLFPCEMALPFGKGEAASSRLSVGHVYVALGKTIRAKGGLILWINGFAPGNLVHLRRSDGAVYWPVNTLAILDMPGGKLIKNRWHPPSSSITRHPREVLGDIRIRSIEEEE